MATTKKIPASVKKDVVKVKTNKPESDLEKRMHSVENDIEWIKLNQKENHAAIMKAISSDVEENSERALIAIEEEFEREDEEKQHKKDVTKALYLLLVLGIVIGYKLRGILEDY